MQLVYYAVISNDLLLIFFLNISLACLNIICVAYNNGTAHCVVIEKRAPLLTGDRRKHSMIAQSAINLTLGRIELSAEFVCKL